MAQTFVLPRQVALDDDANPLAGALLYFFRTSTTTLQETYADAALTIQHSNPVVADASGEFPKIYLNPNATINYRVRLTTADGTQLYQEDDVSAFPLTSEAVGQALYGRTSAEQSSGITPENYARRPLQTIQRETDRYASIADALAVVADGNVTEPVYNLEDWGAPCDGVQDDTPALQALIDALYAIDIHPTSNSRRAMPVIQLPARSLRLKTDLDLGKALGTMGFTIRGCGTWSTQVYVDSGVSITGFGSANLTIANLTFRADEIDDDVTLFVLTTFAGGSLRRWTFDHVDFYQIYKCFQTGGAVVVDEMKFLGCHFLECYHLMENNNEQSVNWNFILCDWESELTETDKDVDDSVMFKLLKGTFVNWYGGSIVLNGSIVLLETSTANDFTQTTHALNFDGVRIELMDNAGFHAPLVTRNAASYAGVNPLKFTLQNFTIDLRGTLPITLNLFDLRNTWTLVLKNGETGGGKVTGFYSATSVSQFGALWLEGVIGITYTEDITDRVSTHDQHHVTLIPNNVSDRHVVPIMQRPGGSTGVSYAQPQRVFVRGTGNDGNLPQGGTTVNLPTFQPHTMLTEICLQQFATTAQTLTVQLRDQADTTTYADVSLAAGSGNRENRDFIGLEIGFQIGTEATPVPLMLKFVGTPDTQKGVVWVEYM
jgi:hypothetical protein